MSKILILNGHQPYPFSEGSLNAAFAAHAQKLLEDAGNEVRVTKVTEGYDVEQEVANHIWATR